MASTSKELGERGKAEEAAVQKYLNALSLRVATFEFERIYDARSAGGKFPARPGDFAFYRKVIHDGTGVSIERTWHGLIEVKALKHDFRLPKARLSSLPKLVKRELSGGIIVILIHHTESGWWRCPSLEFFKRNQDAASWDLEGFRTYNSLDDVMQNGTGVPALR